MVERFKCFSLKDRQTSDPPVTWVADGDLIFPELLVHFAHLDLMQNHAVPSFKIMNIMVRLHLEVSLWIACLRKPKRH